MDQGTMLKHSARRRPPPSPPLAAAPASAKELKSIGITLGSLGNPVLRRARPRAPRRKAKKINPNVKVTPARPTTT